MKFFEVVYKHGKKRSTILIEASNKIEALKKFQNRELGIKISLKEIPEPLSHKYDTFMKSVRSPIKNKRADTEKYISILEQLAVMLDAGMPINICLQEAIKATDDAMLEAIFLEIAKDVESGQSITKSLAPYSKQLGNLSLSMIDLGEQSGTLSESISKLAEILQEMQDNRVKLQKATRYPMMTVVAMTIAFTVVIIFVVPQFESLFSTMKAELPFPTRMLLWMEHAITSFGPYIVAGGVALSVTFSKMYKNSENIALKTDQLMLKVYIIGIVTKFAMLGRFVYIFNVLVKSGVPIVEALHAAVGVVDNKYMKLQLTEITKAIEEGRSLYDGFEASGFFESMILQMLKAGEDAGALGKMLDKITIYYAKKYNNIIDNVSAMIEPILVGAIAGFVLMLALGIFLPMWNMSEAMGG